MSTLECLKHDHTFIIDLHAQASGETRKATQQNKMSL